MLVSHITSDYYIFQEQIAILHELRYYMENCVFENSNWFQNGILVTLKSIIQLQKHMYEKLGLPYLQCANVDQDYHEGFNGQMRVSTGKGGVRNPNHVELNYRIQHWVTSKILDDKNFRNFVTYIDGVKLEGIFGLQRILSSNLKAQKFENDIEMPTIPRFLSESAVDGMYWAAGFVAMRMKGIQNLGDIEKRATKDHAKNTFTKLMNLGGLTLPLITWLQDYMKMEAMFQSYHPKGSIRPGKGLMGRFFIELKKEFQSKYEDPVYKLVTKVLTRFRIRALNKVAKKKRLQENKKGPKTPRGQRKDVDFK